MKLTINLSPKSLISSLTNQNHHNKNNDINKHKHKNPNPNPNPNPSSSASFDSSVDSSTSSAFATPTSVLSDLPRDLFHAFKLIDHDGDGVLSRSHLESLLRRLNPSSSPDELSLMLLEAGCLHRDSVVSIEELLSRVGPACSVEAASCDADELREAFDFFDEDRDGRISAEELLRVFRSLGDEKCSIEDCRRMIDDVDRDGDGFVCFKEFALMMEFQRS